jgi:hypothetical protein
VPVTGPPPGPTRRPFRPRIDHIRGRKSDASGRPYEPVPDLHGRTFVYRAAASYEPEPISRGGSWTDGGFRDTFAVRAAIVSRLDRPSLRLRSGATAERYLGATRVVCG